MSNESSAPEPASLPWDRFYDWLHAVCVVTFDLELGQAMESIHPIRTKLIDQERTSVCYLAFPDSNSGCMGDTQFHFRLPRTTNSHSLTRAQQRYNSDCPNALTIDPSHLYGYVFFRQVKDRSLRRGYFQKSVILLSHLPFVQLFGAVLSLLAPLFFDTDQDHQHQLLDRFCRDVDRWPPPCPGHPLKLPVFHHVFESRIPRRLDRPLSLTVPAIPAAPASGSTVVRCACEPLLYSPLRPVLQHVHLLWELVLTCQPLVVMADSPAVCSHVVHVLTSMIWPLRYGGDYRPFFTIHDSDFRPLTQRNDSRAAPAVLLGVTNPFFAKTLSQWPHTLRVADGFVPNGHTKPAKNKTRKLKNTNVLDAKPGLYTQYKSFLNRDRRVEQQLLKGEQTERPVEVQNALLRRRLHELTESFVLPLERYITSLMPLQRSISPYKSAPVMRPFNSEEFCSKLNVYGPHLTSAVKGDWVGLYRQFFRCANFAEWFNARHADISGRLQALHLDALGDADVVGWMNGKQEVELVDLALRLRRKLSEAGSDPSIPVSSNTLAKLRVHLHDVVSALPIHLQPSLRLQTSLTNSHQHRQILNNTDRHSPTLTDTHQH